MIYEIRHRLDYQYSSPVYLEPHCLHLLPRSDAWQSLKQFHLKVEPQPTVISEITDALGNSAHKIWFRGLTDKLVLEASSVVEITRRNPFDYLLCDNLLSLPAHYSDSLIPLLEPYRKQEGIDQAVEEFARGIAFRTGHETLGFLSELCLEIHNRIRHVTRKDGSPWSPERTLMEGKGACRDLSALFIACCRSQGLAARFTSGYGQSLDNLSFGELHAWAEVYLEGGGWRGYDPSMGLAVSEQHVALASSPIPEFVSPVKGFFRANGAASSLQTQVKIRQSSAQFSSVSLA